MKQFKDFVATGHDQQLLKLIDLVSKDTVKSWKRDRDREQQLRSISIGEDEYTFVFTKKATLPMSSASVFVMLHEGRLEISNIVPVASGRLTHDEYNALVDEFASHCRNRISEANLDVKISVTDDVVAMNALMSEDAWTLLQRFAKLANPSSGSAHPLDFDRWIKFIIKAHNDSAELDANTLTRWFIEDREWAEDVAHDLGSEYSFGRRLLAAYSGQS